MFRTWRLLIPWLVLLLAAGCSVGPNYVEPEIEVPDVWLETTAEEVADSTLVMWWTSLGDTTLTQLMRRAEMANLDLAQAVARVREVRAFRRIAKGDNLPDVVVGGAYTRTLISENGQQGNLVGDGGVFDNPTGVWNVNAGVSWEIDVFGRIRRQVEAATADLEASVEDYRDVLVSLYAEVGINYVDVRTFQRRMDFALANELAQQGSVQITEDRFSAGLTSALDVAQAQSNLANTQATIPALDAQLVAARNRLSVLMGEPPGSLDAMLADTTLRVDFYEPERDPAGLPADLLRRRPDVRRAERQLAAQTARIGETTALLYPSFSIAGFLGMESVELGDLFKGGSFAWGLVPGFSWNIFQGGKIRGQIAVEQARTEQLLLAYEHSVLLALEETENAMAAFDRETQRRNRLLEAVEASQRSVDLVRTQYLSGLTNFQNLLDSQRSLFGQQDQMAESQGQVFRNLISLNRALGGGWDLESGAPDEDPELAGNRVDEEPDKDRDEDAGDSANEEADEEGGER